MDGLTNPKIWAVFFTRMRRARAGTVHLRKYIPGQ
jgi:hypothetical protein